jgi:hypothetical protein
MPPGVPPERVAALQQAFMDTFRDPELLAEAHKISLDAQPDLGRSGAGGDRQDVLRAAGDHPEGAGRDCVEVERRPYASSLSSSAQADDPVIAGVSIKQPASAITGPRLRGDDRRKRYRVAFSAISIDCIT